MAHTAEDADRISQRIAELAAERAAVLNTQRSDESCYYCKGVGHVEDHFYFVPNSRPCPVCNKDGRKL